MSIAERIQIAIYAIVGFITIYYHIIKCFYLLIDRFFFHTSEKAERQMLHDLITDCEDYKQELEQEGE